MKIAVPTDDGIHICGHFGRCQQFLVFEVQEGRVTLAEKRANAGCHGHDAGAHNHAGILDALRDCQAVLCAGIGARAVETLQAGGITVVMADTSGSAEQLVAAYAAGRLPSSTKGFCRCQH